MTTFQSFQQQDTTPNTAQPSPGIIGGAKNLATGYGNEVKNAFTGAINTVGAGFNEANAPASNPLQAVGNLVKGGSHIAEGLVGIPGSLAAPAFTNPAVQGGIQKAGNALESTYGSNVEKGLSLSAPGSTGAEKALSATNTAGNILGGVAGGEGAIESISNIWDKSKSMMTGPSAADTAEASMNAQGNVAATSLENSTQKLADYRNTTMGQEFAQGAQEIMKQNPNAHAVVPNDILDKLNELKDTAKFQLPDYLRTSSPQFGENLKLGDLSKNGVSLNPLEMQDLIRRTNQLTYAAKASGDLKVNQSTVGLVNDLHSIASDAFGNVKDESGAPIWDKTYSNFSKSANVVSKMSDLINIDKNAGPVDMFNKLNAFKKLLGDSSGKALLKNAVEELKNTTGVDLTNTSGEIQKFMDSEDTFKESQKPGFLKQMINPQRVGNLGMRVIMYATLGAWIRGAIKSLTP